MPSNLSKPIDKLKLSDLDAFPIWEYDDEGKDGQDETWVRPVPAQVVPLHASSLSVRATFTLANGTTARGFLGVTTATKELDMDDGVILSTGQYLFIPNRFPADLQNFLDAISLSEQDVFPIKYQLDVMIEGEENRRTGMIELSTE